MLIKSRMVANTSQVRRSLSRRRLLNTPLSFIITFIYIMATASFGAYWCSKYGLVGPSSGAAAFGVSSWMIGLISLVTTVMFK